MAKFDLSDFVVRGVDGVVDVDASQKKFSEALWEFVDQSEADSVRISDAVNAVFDENRGQTLQVNSVVTFAFLKMGVKPSEFQAMSDKIKDWIKTSPAFVILRGKGGGVQRIADMPPKEKK